MMMRYQHYIEKAHRTSSVKENDFSKQNEDTAWLCTCYYTLIFDKAANYNKYDLISIGSSFQVSAVVFFNYI